MRYVVHSWLGRGRAAEPHQVWKTWGRKRAQKAADSLVREYREQKLSDFEVTISEARSLTVVWFFSTDREREGLPPLDEPIRVTARSH
jgi:hypothetical protein